jgi:hypothetical protein
MLKLGRKIKKLKFKILNHLKINFIYIYMFFILLAGIYKFILIKFRKKTNYKYSNNFDEINYHEFRKYSQNNEDGIIDYVFSKIKSYKINSIEIGFDYYENNSLNLLRNANKLLLIEASKDKCFVLNIILSIFYPLTKKKISNTFVTKNNINKLINNFYLENEEIDYISIDVDGNDYFLMEALNFKPKLIIIEYNFWLGKEESITIPYQEDYSWDGSIYYGASLLALNTLANKKNYSLIAIDSSCTNAFFIRNDLAHNFSILDPIKSFKIPTKYNNTDLLFAKRYLEKKSFINIK